MLESNSIQILTGTVRKCDCLGVTKTWCFISPGWYLFILDGQNEWFHPHFGVYNVFHCTRAKMWSKCIPQLCIHEKNAQRILLCLPICTFHWLASFIERHIIRQHRPMRQVGGGGTVPLRPPKGKELSKTSLFPPFFLWVKIFCQEC